MGIGRMDDDKQHQWQENQKAAVLAARGVAAGGPACGIGTDICNQQAPVGIVERLEARVKKLETDVAGNAAHLDITAQALYHHVNQHVTNTGVHFLPPPVDQPKTILERGPVLAHEFKPGYAVKATALAEWSCRGISGVVVPRPFYISETAAKDRVLVMVRSGVVLVMRPEGLMVTTSPW